MNRDVYFLRSRSKPSILSFKCHTICTHLESLVYTMERNLQCFIPSCLRLKDLEFWLFRLFNRIFDLNTSFCDQRRKVKIYMSSDTLNGKNLWKICVTLHPYVNGQF